MAAGFAACQSSKFHEDFTISDIGAAATQEGRSSRLDPNAQPDGFIDRNDCTTSAISIVMQFFSFFLRSCFTLNTIAGRIESRLLRWRDG
jgi:hypothetical protein